MYGEQTLCIREPHPPGELCEGPGRGELEPRTGENLRAEFINQVQRFVKQEHRFTHGSVFSQLTLRGLHKSGFLDF